MAFYLTFGKKKNENIDINRFRSALHVFHDLFLDMKKQNTSILFYLEEPLQEINPEFKRHDFKFGIIESNFRSRLEKLEQGSIKAGFEIETELSFGKKSFTLVLTLLPRRKSQYYDIKIELLSNSYAHIFEDLEKFYPKLRKYIYERILFYNRKSEKKKKEELFTIKRAIMSDHKKEFHSIEDWRFFYSREPEEFINNLSYGDNELRERLIYANRQKFAEALRKLNQFVLQLFEYAKETQVEIKEGSIAVIPKTDKSMKIFVNKLRKKVIEAAKLNYPTEQELQRNLEKVFSRRG